MTHSGRTALLIGGAVAVACSIWFWRSASTRESGGPEQAVAAGALSQESRILQEISALKRDNERLRADLARLQEHRFGRREKRAGAASSTDSDDQVGEQESAAEAEAADAERTAAQFEAIQAGFLSQTRDPDWSAAATREIAGMFKPDRSAGSDPADSLTGSTIRESDCRATLCRIVVSHADEQARNSFAHAFMGRVPSDMPQGVFAPPDSTDGPLTTVVYLARANTDFPRAAGNSSP